MGPLAPLAQAAALELAGELSHTPIGPTTRPYPHLGSTHEQTGSLDKTSPVPVLWTARSPWRSFRVNGSKRCESGCSSSWAEAASSVVALNTATNNVLPANYASCAAPCMTRITLSGSHNDTWSAPFYDYSDDAMYVGDDSGSLHKFIGVFLGTPSEVSSGYPVALGATLLASPVYDSGPQEMFSSVTPAASSIPS